MMKLFSEKVNPTFTNSAHNILTVESFEEVFYDVFEFEINGTKYIAEKQSEYKGCPVVAIPVTVGKEKHDIPFVLVEGKFNILFNQKTFKQPGEKKSYILEDISYDKVLGYRDEVLEEINQTKQLAEEYAERVKIKQISEVARNVKEREQNIIEAVNNIKGEIVDDFNAHIIQNRSDLEAYNERKYSELKSELDDKVDNSFSLFLDHNNDRIEQLTNTLNGKIDKLVERVIVEKVDPALVDVLKKNKNAFTKIEDSLKIVEQQISKRLKEDLHKDILDNKQYIDDVERMLVEQNVEVNDKVKKGVDKALSRIGNVKTAVGTVIGELEGKVDTSISKLEEKFLANLERIDKELRDYYDVRIEKIEKDKTLVVSEGDKQEIVNLLKESKDSVLEQYGFDKHKAIQKVQEEKFDPEVGSKEFAKSVKQLRSELEKAVSSRFTNEISSLKKLIEFSSGGGSVAVQYKDGGIMHGDLTVKGCVVADCFIIADKTHTDYTIDNVFRDDLVKGVNSTTTFTLETNPRLSTAKFHATYVGTGEFDARTFVEIWVGVHNEECFVETYATIHTNNSEPVLDTVTCSLTGNKLIIESDVNDECSVTLAGRATYVTTPPNLTFGSETPIEDFWATEDLLNIFGPE